MVGSLHFQRTVCLKCLSSWVDSQKSRNLHPQGVWGQSYTRLYMLTSFSVISSSLSAEWSGKAAGRADLAGLQPVHRVCCTLQGAINFLQYIFFLQRETLHSMLLKGPSRVISIQSFDFQSPDISMAGKCHAKSSNSLKDKNFFAGYSGQLPISLCTDAGFLQPFKSSHRTHPQARLQFNSAVYR